MKQSELRQIIKEEISKVLKENDIVDKILDKISAQGKDSLTPEEEEYLNRYSRDEKDIPEPVTLQNKSASSVKAQIYPPMKTSKEVELYDDIAREFLKPLIDVIAQQLEISPKDIRASFAGMWKKDEDKSLRIQIKLPNDTWGKPRTINNLIMQTESGDGIIINNYHGVLAEYDKRLGVTLPEVEEAYDDLYYNVKREKILNLVKIKLSQFLAGFADYDYIAPNTPILYTGE